MPDFEATNIFTDLSLVDAPHPYFDFLRSKGGAVRLPQHDVVAVVGYDAALAVLCDNDGFSAVNAITGSFPPLPFVPEGDDISAQIEVHRDSMTLGGIIATQDRAAPAASIWNLPGAVWCRPW